MRSGSTLLGEVFKQHKDVLYLFEPFRVAEKSGESDSESKEKKLNWLHRFLKCNFNDVFKWSKDPLIAKKKGGLSLEKVRLGHKELPGLDLKLWKDFIILVGQSGGGGLYWSS